MLGLLDKVAELRMGAFDGAVRVGGDEMGVFGGVRGTGQRAKPLGEGLSVLRF